MEEHVMICEKVSKRFGRQIAVRDVSLSIYPGEIYGLAGPNGAGKTTWVLDPWPIRIFLPLWNQESSLPITFEKVTGGTVHFEKLTGMVSLETGLVISTGYFIGLLYLTFRHQEIT